MTNGNIRYNLRIEQSSRANLNCARCGVSICSGRFCQTCASILVKEFNTSVAYNEIGNKPMKEVTGKMRYLDGNNM